MDFKYHLERSWTTVWNNVGPVLIITVVQICVTFASLGILAPVTGAGYMQSILLAIREGRPPEVRDLFSHFSLFLPLFLFGLATFAVVGTGTLLLFLPGLILALLITYVCLYMVPLMTDKELPIFEAINRSWETVKSDPVSDHVITAIIFVVIMMLGTSIAFGVLVTQPIAIAFLMSVYEEKVAGEVLTDTSDTSGQESKMGPPPPPPQS